MNFKRFSTSDNQWYDVPYYQHKTATDTLTLPAVIYPNDTSITVGIKGNEEHTGTPTPQNPVMPQGTGERTGNLFDISSVIYGTWTDNSGRAQSYGYGARSINISSNQITVSFNGSVFPYSYSIVWLDSNDEFIVRNHISASPQIREPQTFTPPSNAAKFYIQLANGTDGSAPITKEQIESYKLMLNAGSTALPYEPYGIKIPISCGGTTTPVYLGEVETTRRVKKLVLTGEEINWYYYENATSTVKFFYLVVIRTAGVNLNNLLNTHGFNMVEVAQQSGNVLIRVYAASEGMGTVEEWKAYLAAQYANGTPVTVWYVLAEPETGIVNEPLRKIGNYADSLTTSIPVTAGENTLDVQTTVQPSEVSAGFSGWHPVTNTHVMEGLLADNPLCGISTYKDTLNLATGACTRQIKKIDLGTLNWSKTKSGNFWSDTAIEDMKAVSNIQQNNALSDMFTEVVPERVASTPYSFSSCLNNQQRPFINSTGFENMSGAEFRQAMSGVYMYYVLAEPTTETITVPTGLSGTEEGYLNQSGTPTPSAPIYPTANEVPMWD